MLWRDHGLPKGSRVLSSQPATMSVTPVILIATLNTNAVIGMCATAVVKDDITKGYTERQLPILSLSVFGCSCSLLLVQIIYSGSRKRYFVSGSRYR